MEWLLHEAALAGSGDVAALRHCVRRSAELLGVEPSAQTRFLVAVTAAALAALEAATTIDATVGVALQPSPMLLVELTCNPPNPPITVDTSALQSLVDICHTADAPVATLRLGRTLRRGVPPGASLAALRHSLALDRGAPVDEMAAQNQALLTAMAEADRVGAELEDTNRGVVALYAELDERAEQLRQASELKSRFLSHMSHEFRTPLNSILALTRLLLDRLDGPLTDEQEKQVGYIRRSAESLTELVNDLLDLAKVEAGKLALRPQPFTAGALFGGLRGVMRPLLQSDAVELVFDEPVDCPTLVTDEAKVAQVLRNLISNALKFTEQGEVRVSATVDADTGYCRFTVRDSGIGIAAQDRELVFQEFSQVASRLQGRARGTGLGLPLSRRLAELLGGTLTLESTPGVGSSFTLAIPPLLASPDAEVPLAQPAWSQPSRARVLVIDDEEASRYVLRQMMAGIPHIEFLETQNGAQGLQQAKLHRPDVILLDLNMPGINGFEVLERLGAEAETQAIPVVICTSSVLDDADRARLVRAAAILSKAELSRVGMAAAIAPLLPGRPDAVA